jgi:hypothetical protein
LGVGWGRRRGSWVGVWRRWFLFCGLGRVGGGRRTTGADSQGDAGRQIHGRAEKVRTSFCLHFVLFSSRKNEGIRNWTAGVKKNEWLIVNGRRWWWAPVSDIYIRRRTYDPKHFPYAMVHFHRIFFHGLGPTMPCGSNLRMFGPCFSCPPACLPPPPPAAGGGARPPLRCARRAMRSPSSSPRFVSIPPSHLLFLALVEQSAATSCVLGLCPCLHGYCAGFGHLGSGGCCNALLDSESSGRPTGFEFLFYPRLGKMKSAVSLLIRVLVWERKCLRKKNCHLFFL